MLMLFLHNEIYTFSKQITNYIRNLTYNYAIVTYINLNMENIIQELVEYSGKLFIIKEDNSLRIPAFSLIEFDFSE